MEWSVVGREIQIYGGVGKVVQGCPAPQVRVRVKVKVKSRLNTVIGADFHIRPQ